MPLVYVYILPKMYIYVCFLLFGILTDSIFLLFSVIRLHKAYAKHYHSHLYVTLLHYIPVYIMVSVDCYLFYFIKRENNLVMKKTSVLYI